MGSAKKRLAAAIFVVIFAVVLVMQIGVGKAQGNLTFVCSSSAAATSTAACSGEQAGDLLLVGAFTSASSTVPTTATGFTSINTAANTAGSTTTRTALNAGWATAASSSTGSGTWTGATEVIMQVYRGQASNPIGNNATQGGSNSGTVVTYGADTLSATDGTSWFAGFAVRNTAQALMSTAPSGMTNRASSPATPVAAGHDTNGPTSSNWSSTNVSGFSVAAKFTSIVIELKAAPVSSMLNQTGYTIENDDGSGVNGNSVQAGSSFSSGQTISGVKQGERLTIRTQIKNTGAGKTDFSNLGLFYDRGDGIWTKVRQAAAPVTGSGSGCNAAAWTCTAVDTANDTGHNDSMAIDPAGNPWVSYWDGTSLDLRVARFVGSGGSGCALASWSCTTVDTSSANVGQYTSIAFDPAGNPWVSYQDFTNGDLRVAHYLGGATTGTGCAVTTWTCTSVDTANVVGLHTSIAFDPAGNPWISYLDGSTNDLRIAQYLGGATTGTGCAVTTWTCTAVDTANNVQGATSIAFDPAGNPWVSYQDFTNSDLRVARFVGSGGSGCAVTTWTCTGVDTTNGVGDYSSIAFDPSGNPWVSYYDATNSGLRMAQYLGGATTGSGCALNTWSCTAVDTANAVGFDTSIAFDPSGNPWVSYYDNTNNDLRVAQYLGGATTGTGCALNTWSCTAVDTANAVGLDSSIAFDPSGNPWVSYLDSTNGDLRLASLSRAGDITMSSGLAGANGGSLTSSHADMTSAGDSTNASDADCLGGGTWNNGNWFTSPEALASLPAGNSTAQCTEVAFTIDTSQAIAGDTYRFVIASKDNWRDDKGPWRGPISVSSGAYPSLTIASSTSQRYTKDSLPEMSACTAGGWNCAAVDSTNSVGLNTSIAFDPSGNPWVSYYDATNLSLRVARYVGSGGSGCALSSWSCTTVDITSHVGQETSIAFDPSGNPWVSYYDATNSALRVAKYLGGATTGSGCSINTWTCTSVDTANDVGRYTSIAFDPAGNPWVSYHDVTNLDLRVARYVGSGGSGCALSSWSCTAVDSTNSVGLNTSIAFDPAGNPWVSYIDSTNSGLRVARYVGSGGSGCALSSWSCTAVETGNITTNSSIGFDSAGNPWISYYDGFNLTLRVARYLGGATTGTGCTINTWTCTTVDTSSSGNITSAIAFDSSGNPWISYYVSSSLDLRVARYLGGATTGTGCTINTWTCTAVDTPNSVGDSNSIAFDPSGNPWVSYQDSTNGDLRLANLSLPPNPLTATDLYTNTGRNAPRSDGRWHLDGGYAPRASSGSCTATTDYLGYCGLSASDSVYDSVAAKANERPIYNFSFQTSSNTSAPPATWVGKSTVAASTKNLVLQVYQNGTTNAWVTVTTNITCSANTTCTITGTPTGTASEFYVADGSNYDTFWRLYQVENSSAETLSSDYFNISSGSSAPTTDQLLRGGQYFSSGTKQPFYWAQ